MKHFDRLNQVRPSGDKRGLLFQFMTEIFVDVTRMNHGRVKTPDVHDPLLPHSAFDLPAVTARGWGDLACLGDTLCYFVK